MKSILLTTFTAFIVGFTAITCGVPMAHAVVGMMFTAMFTTFITNA